MTRVWISIGSNIDREQNIRAAVSALRKHFGEIVLSPVYESDAVGFEGDPFYNLVVGFDSQLSPKETSASLKAIEISLGRTQNEKKFASRNIDLDLLTFGSHIIDAPELKLPRNEILSYAFVLKPLADVAPEEIHPETGKSYAELWRDYEGDKRLTETLLPVDD